MEPKAEWYVRDSDGKMQGPYTLEQVIRINEKYDGVVLWKTGMTHPSPASIVLNEGTEKQPYYHKRKSSIAFKTIAFLLISLTVLIAHLRFSDIHYLGTPKVVWINETKAKVDGFFVTPGPNETVLKIKGYLIAQDVIRKHLKSPATAKFPPHKEVWFNGDVSFPDLSSYVDSQNGFGAMLRSRWECKLSYQDYKKEWELWSLKIIDSDGKIVMDEDYSSKSELMQYIK